MRYKLKITTGFIVCLLLITLYIKLSIHHMDYPLFYFQVNSLQMSLVPLMISIFLTILPSIYLSLILEFELKLKTMLSIRDYQFKLGYFTFPALIMTFVEGVFLLLLNMNLHLVLLVHFVMYLLAAIIFYVFYHRQVVFPSLFIVSCFIVNSFVFQILV